MIEPTYQRTQLWRPVRRRIHRATVVGALTGFVVVIAALVPARHHYVFIDGGPESRAQITVAKLVEEAFPAWRERHAGCPHRLAELGPRLSLDPWGHALHYTCDRRLAPGRDFAVRSAGADGVFGTADDIERSR